MNIIDLLNESGLVTSKSEARRLISEKAIKIDGEVVNDINEEIKIEFFDKLFEKKKTETFQLSGGCIL